MSRSPRSTAEGDHRCTRCRISSQWDLHGLTLFIDRTCGSSYLMQTTEGGDGGLGSNHERGVCSTPSKRRWGSMGDGCMVGHRKLAKSVLSSLFGNQAITTVRDIERHVSWNITYILG